MEQNTYEPYVHGERVSSTYAEIYFQDDYCDYRKPLQVEFEGHYADSTEQDGEDWVSPSDLLIGVIELKPPFTSKITRGKTHEGILAIGNGVLENERAKFLNNLTNLLNDNDNGWAHILESERKIVQQKVRRIYDNIFENKTKIMSKEIAQFYEKTLQELEDHLRSELQTVLISTHANIVSALNVQIKKKLGAEKKHLENALINRYGSEVKKVKHYYNILFNNEVQKNKRLINQASYERNDALAAFYRQIEAENITSTMYVMCAERKKCKVRQFILDTYQTTDISEKMQKVKEKQRILDSYKNKKVHICQIHKEWDEKIKKVLQLFLKFISFSLKLLPEQTTFLLDLEKMIVLQINEIQKYPKKCPSVLQMEEEIMQNVFKFEQSEPEATICKDEPFVIVGDLSDIPPPKYGSRETLTSDVDLPYIRVDRHFIYAECHKFEQIKELLESQRCICRDNPAETTVTDIPIKLTEVATAPPSPSPAVSESLDEPLLIDVKDRIDHCPARSCQKWTERNSFPYLNSYLDFTEENYERVKTILGEPTKKIPPISLIDPKKYVDAELPFAATKEPYHNVETQYSSQEELYVPEIGCTCFDTGLVKGIESIGEIIETHSKDMNAILQKRRTSLRNLIQKHPNLLKMFTDECFDFQL